MPSPRASQHDHVSRDMLTGSGTARYQEPPPETVFLGIYQAGRLHAVAAATKYHACAFPCHIVCSCTSTRHINFITFHFASEPRTSEIVSCQNRIRPVFTCHTTYFTLSSRTKDYARSFRLFPPYHHATLQLRPTRVRLRHVDATTVLLLI